jgi:hypothetical protein
VRRGLSAARDAAVVLEITPHWGAALPGAGMVIESAMRTLGVMRS